MNKKGFTLIELLAVIVILAIVLAIAIPSINNITYNAKANAYIDQMDILKRAAELYMARNSSSSGDVTITLNDLVSAGILSGSIKNPVTGQAFSTGVNVLVKRSSGTTTYEVYEGPELAQGMIPVYYDGTNWVKADQSNSTGQYQWYDYNLQKWANAVTVVANGTQTRAYYQGSPAGTTIALADINAFFVWIPRFKYMIPAGTGAREIKVEFEHKYTPKSTGDAIANHLTHPAFTFDTTELGGIWVGKFETTGTIAQPTILPNATSLRDQTIKVIYESVKNNMQGSSTFGFSNTDSDIHMMKNTEWGAVAYLSTSKYGKYGNSSYIGANKEVYKNNSSNHFTGRSMGAPGGAGVLTPTYEYSASGYYTYDGKCASIYAGLAAPCTSGGTGQILADKNNAYGASTTGTIYGIYDMSGEAYQYVMGVYKPTPLSGIRDCSGYSNSYALPMPCPLSGPYDSQYESLTINSKYYNQYLTTSAVTGAILGDATKETSGWYGDSVSFVSAAGPWLRRGGRYDDANNMGIYSASAQEGKAVGDVSFRITLATNP